MLAPRVQSGSCVGWLQLSRHIVAMDRDVRQPDPGTRPVADAGLTPVWLKAAGRAQRPLRVHESKSGIEIEPLGIIDALRPDVAPEIAQCHVVRRQAQGPVDRVRRQFLRPNEALTRPDVTGPL